MDLFYPSVFFLLFLITILSLRKVIFPNLAWYLFVNPDGLDLWFPRDSVDQVHQLPILTEDPLLDPGDSAGIHSSLGDPAFINIINDDINADVIPGLCVKQIKSTINQMTLHLVLGQRVPVESSSCLNLCAISSCFKEWFSKFEIDRSWLEGGGGVDAHQAARQVLVGGSGVEGARNLWGEKLHLHSLSRGKTDRPCEPTDAYLVHEIRETLAGLELVLAKHMVRQLGSRCQGGEEEDEQHARVVDEQLEQNEGWLGCVPAGKSCVSGSMGATGNQTSLWGLCSRKIASNLICGTWQNWSLALEYC